MARCNKCGVEIGKTSESDAGFKAYCDECYTLMDEELANIDDKLTNLLTYEQERAILEYPRWGDIDFVNCSEA